YLPNYGVFDEFRYFQPGKRCPVLRMNRATIGVSICEDIWYPDGPVFLQALSGGAEVIVNISSSPYHAGKGRWRERMLATPAGGSRSSMSKRPPRFFQSLRGHGPIGRCLRFPYRSRSLRMQKFIKLL